MNNLNNLSLTSIVLYIINIKLASTLTLPGHATQHQAGEQNLFQSHECLCGYVLSMIVLNRSLKYALNHVKKMIYYIYLDNTF